MARLIHLNGPPGIGKSTLSALYTGRHPGALNLDVDTIHRLVGGWRDDQTDTWPAVWSLVRGMAAVHLAGGHDVVLPQYLATSDEIDGFERIAREHGAGFHEIVLVDEQETTIERFHRRARDSDDAWIRHHHRLVARAGGSTVLGIMYDDLMEVVRLRPGAVLVPSVVDEVQATYASLVEALGSTGFDG
ncbi:AAA family ATPase [Micromonospora sp. WMMD714]|uniref:AAA family ATPase n=1 Tax=Micromonospora sp. WMMD714 TaxID=3016097 RepID=UPI00249B2D93|nr:AAA family ATPase [Micromonospora sp. WMMD714]WFE62912.1 AAA family ATPase [Micromonospora sp. WMMD714]